MARPSGASDCRSVERCRCRSVRRAVVFQSLRVAAVQVGGIESNAGRYDRTAGRSNHGGLVATPGDHVRVIRLHVRARRVVLYSLAINVPLDRRE